MFNPNSQTKPLYSNTPSPCFQLPQLQQRGFNQPAQPYFCSFGNLPTRHNGIDYQNRIGTAQSPSPYYYSSPCSPALKTPQYQHSPQNAPQNTSSQQKIFLPLINNSPIPMIEITINHKYSNFKVKKRTPTEEDVSVADSRRLPVMMMNIPSQFGYIHKGTQRSLTSRETPRSYLAKKKIIPTVPQIGELDYYDQNTKSPTSGLYRAENDRVDRTPRRIEGYLGKLNKSLKNIDEKLSSLNNLIEKEKAPKKSKNAIMNRHRLEESKEESDESLDSLNSTSTLKFEDEADSEINDKNLSSLLDKLNEEDSRRLSLMNAQSLPKDISMNQLPFADSILLAKKKLETSKKKRL